MPINRISDWWESALTDLEIAEDDLRRGWYADSCFHAQQAAEKALKTLLIANGLLVRTHDLLRLLRLAERHGLDSSGLEPGSLRRLF